jgi:methyl acetate hydrolase
MSTRTVAVSTPLDRMLHDAVDRGAVPQVVAVAADADGLLYEGAAGPRVVGSPAPVDSGSVFRIASMTKIICTVAALQQRDRGTLDFEAPVETYCPDFADVPVLDGYDDELPRLRPPRSRATVRQLLTHTAGLAYSFWNADLARWAKLPPPRSRRPGLVGPFAAPMVADPGAEVTYGIGTDWLGRVVEAVSGQALDAYLTEHVFGPLNMTSTTFRLDDDQRSRAVPVHDRDETGSWAPTDLDWDRNPQFWPGGHGLYSTARDFLTFSQMLLDGGSYGGAPILTERSVQEMFCNQIGKLWFPTTMATTDPTTSADFRVGKGMKWGWGLLLNTRREPGMRTAGSGGWAGIFNTYFWVDRTTGVAGTFLSQCRPFLDPAVLQVYAAFEKAIYAQRSRWRARPRLLVQAQRSGTLTS